MARKFNVNKDDLPEQRGDPFPGCCDLFTDYGRCHYPGVLSSGGGKFFCKDHFYRTSKIVPFDADAVTIRSHHDIPHPDYSLEARQSLSRWDFQKEQMKWLEKNRNADA